MQFSWHQTLTHDDATLLGIELLTKGRNRLQLPRPKLKEFLAIDHSSQLFLP